MSAPRLTFRWIPGGDTGAKDTLLLMRTLVRKAQSDPLLHQTVRAILRSAPVGDATEQARVLRDWLSEHFTFVPDPGGFELLQEPFVMLREIHRTYVATGDCDDAAILGAALAVGMQLKPRFRALAFVEPTAPYSHVITDVLTPVGWLDLDVTKSSQMIPPVVSRQMTTMEI